MPTATEAEPKTEEAPTQEGTEREVTQEAEPKPEKKAFDPNSIAPEINDYYSKKYDGHDKYKAMSSEYENLLRSPLFQEWYQGLNKPKATPQKEFELSDDQYLAAMSNKDHFKKVVADLALQIVDQKIGPQLQKTEAQLELTAKSNELDKVISQYPDFMELDKRGLIEPVLQKYPRISFEDAYWIAKKHTHNEDVDKKARGLVASKKNASTERPGTPPGAKTHKVKVKTKREAMLIAAEAYKAGRETPEIEFE